MAREGCDIIGEVLCKGPKDMWHVREIAVEGGGNGRGAALRLQMRWGPCGCDEVGEGGWYVFKDHVAREGCDVSGGRRRLYVFKGGVARKREVTYLGEI